jgi:hypothetical protein
MKQDRWMEVIGRRGVSERNRELRGRRKKGINTVTHAEVNSDKGNDQSI